MEVKTIGVRENILENFQEKLVTYEVTFDTGAVQYLEFATPFDMTDEEAIDHAWQTAKDVVAYLETQSCDI